MKWLELTSEDLPRACKKAKGVAMIPVGSLERHGPHMPLGTDTLVAGRIADMVAEREPVVVLPTIPYTCVAQCKYHPGAVHVLTDVLVRHLSCICDEVYRNGFDKIVLLHAHGGNVPMSQTILLRVLETERKYALYSFAPLTGVVGSLRHILESTHTGHACELETSIGLALFPELIKMNRVKGKKFERSNRPDVGGAATPVSWIAAWPGMTVGEPQKGTAEKGKKFVEAWVKAVVEGIRKIKKDKVVPEHLRRIGRRHLPK